MQKLIAVGCIMSALVVSGCASANKLTRLNPGMSKSEVILAMGTPTDTEMHDGAEYLRYWLYDGAGVGNHYFVRLVDGKLESYKPLNSGFAPLLILP